MNPFHQPAMHVPTLTAMPMHGSQMPMSMPHMPLSDGWFWNFVNHSRRVLHSIPTSLWLTLLAIIILSFVLSSILVRAKKTRGQDKRANEPDLQTSPNQPNLANEHKEHIPPMGGLLSQYLLNKGYLAVGDISSSFLRALAFIKKTLQTSDPLYHLPWFLVLGAERSGKSSLFETSGLNLPLGTVNFSKGKANPKLKWWFLDQGIFIELRGDCLLKKNAAASDSAIRTLTQLLKRYRSARPLNGIVVTIPATELYGKHQLSPEEINQRATHMAQNLARTQRTLGLKLPVYIVITKTDCVPGFGNFCARLPAFNKQNMLGWSNPYAVGTSYSDSFIDEAFQSIGNTLHQLRLAIFSSHGDTAHNDGVFIFARELMTLQESAGHYLSTLFNPSAYNDGLLFRGLYFTGSVDNSVNHTEAVLLNDQNSIQTNAHLHPGKKKTKSAPLANQTEASDHDPAITLVSEQGENAHYNADSTLHAADDSPAFQLYAFNDKDDEGSMPSNQNWSVQFVCDLFIQKIMFEAGLATPYTNRPFNDNRGVMLAKMGVGCILILGSYGLMNAYSTFSKSRNLMHPILVSMNTALKDIKIGRQDINTTATVSIYQSVEQFSLHTRQIIDMMVQLQQTDLVSFFVPASWFSSVHQSLHESLRVAFQEIIIRSIANGLVVRAQELLYLKPKAQDVSTSLSQLLVPTQSAEFKLVKRYVDGLNALNTYIAMYHALRRTGEPAHLRALIEYTFKGELPADFWQHYHTFRVVLRDVTVRPMTLDAFQGVARKTLGHLYQNFLAIIFSKAAPHSLPSRLTQLIDMLDEKKPMVHPDSTLLRDISQQLSQTVPTLGGMGKTWLDQPYVNLGKDLSDLFDAIDTNRLFGKDVTQFLVNQTAKGFEALKKDLAQINSSIVPGIGGHSLEASAAVLLPTASHNKEAVEAPSPYTSLSLGIFVLERVLGTLYTQDFMQASKPARLITTIPDGKTVAWDTSYIAYAYQLAQNHDTYITKQLSTIPFVFHKKLKRAVLESLQHNIMNIVSQAQRFEDIPTAIGDAELESLLYTKARDLTEITPQFLKLLAVLSKDPSEIYTHNLRTVLTKNAFWFLETSIRD